MLMFIWLQTWRGGANRRARKEVVGADALLFIPLLLLMSHQNQYIESTRQRA